MTDDYVIEAARFWHGLTGERVAAEAGERLSGARDTIVCRLQSERGAIIAKRCPATTAALERTVYERILKCSRVPSLRFHGTIDKAERDAWLFVDDAAGRRYDPRDPVHRTLAAQWLARLHCRVADPAGLGSLPGKWPKNYRQLLGDVTKTLVELKTAGATDADRQRVVDCVADHCRRLADGWDAIEAACTHTPASLVHGDIVTHNARIRETPSGLEFVLFDWEKAGWGTPAEDVSDIDLAAYLAAAGPLGSTTSAAALQQLAGAGKAFRCLVFLQWLAPDLMAQSAAAYEQLDLCRGWLDQINDQRPWAR